MCLTCHGKPPNQDGLVQSQEAIEQADGQEEGLGPATLTKGGSQYKLLGSWPKHWKTTGFPS